MPRNQTLFVLVCLIWGATWVPLKIGLASVPPIVFAGTRFLAAGVLLLGLCAVRRDRMRIARADWPRLAIACLLLIALPYALLFWGAQFLSTGMAAILDLSFMPACLLGVGAAMGQEQLTRPRLAGLAAGIAGLLVLFGPKALQPGPGGGAELAGGAAIVLSALVYATGSALARPLLRRHSPLLISGITTLAGGAILALVAALFEPGARAALRLHWSAPVWAAWLFLVLAGSLVAYTAYLILVRSWGTARAGAYAFVSPIVAVLLGLAVYGEAIGPRDAVGMATMLVGAFLTLRPVPGTAAP